MHFIEQYLRKSTPTDVSLDDLRGFLKRRVEEHQTLEYKPRGILVLQDGSLIRPTNRYDVRGGAALAKVVASFANAAGGLLVLGVKEKVTKSRGVAQKIYPGQLTWLPETVTREYIEDQIAAHISPPLEHLTVTPVRNPRRTLEAVYLVDVAASLRAPHRVGELFYYQRNNHTTRELQHFEIADMIGARRKPVLELVATVLGGSITGTADGRPLFRGTIFLALKNTGRGLAKFPFVEFRVASPSGMREFNVDRNGERLTGILEPGLPRAHRYGGGSDVVIHSSMASSVTRITFGFAEGDTFDGCEVKYVAAAEDTEPRSGNLHIPAGDLASIVDAIDPTTIAQFRRSNSHG